MEILTGKACLQSGLAEHQPAAIDRGETESSGVKQMDLESVIQSEESQKNKSFSLVAIFPPMVSLSLFSSVVSLWFLFEGGEAVNQTFKLWLVVQNCDMKTK